MVHSLSKKVRKLTTNLNLPRTLKLVWTVSKGWATVSILVTLLETALFFASLYLLKLIVDQLSGHATNKETITLNYILIAATASVFYVGVKAFSTYVTEVQASKVSEHIDDKIHESALRLDLSFFESPDYFDILKRAKDAGSDRPNLIITTLVEISKNAITLMAIGTVLISIHWMLLPLLALFVLPTLFVRIKFADRLNVLRIQNTELERKSNYFSTLITSDTSAKEIRGFGLGNYLRGIYNETRVKLLTDRLKISGKRTVNEIITNSLATMGFFSCIAFIVMGTVKGETSVGDITLFLIAFPQSFTVMQNLASGVSILYQNSIFVNSIFELIDLEGGLKEEKNSVPIPNEEDIPLEIEDLTFQYPHSEKPTLKNISLTIPSGKIIAIVGLNGAGKSTLIKLISRLYDPSSGKIKLGGIDIKMFKGHEYRKQISAVFQDFSKYNVSAGDNIRFGDIDGDRTEDEIIEASQNSGAHGYIKNFPEGYQTTMGRIFEDGQEVSIGQWQKLAIARAFFSPARFLILDEATSALDAKAEKELFDSFRERIGSRAALVISHRLSAVRHADYIYVLSGGEIGESGTHEELMNIDGDYSRLFKNSLTEV